MIDHKTTIEIIEYEPRHQPWFESLNRTWIEKYFWMEPLDVLVLEHPDEYIIKPGGSILMAYWKKNVAGTVALKHVEPGVYEFTKMAVDVKFQGKGIGNALTEAAIQKTRQRGAKKIILYSNTMLAQPSHCIERWDLRRFRLMALINEVI